MQNKHNKSSFLSSLMTTVVLFGLVVVFVISVISIIRKQHTAEQNKQKAIIEQNKFEEQKKILENETEHLNTEYGVEQVLREKFGVVKEGEHVVVIVDKIDEGINDDQNSTPEKGIVGFIRGLFGLD